jgi:hypothetical protein
MNEPKAPPKLGEANEWQRFCTETLMDTIGLPEHQRALAWSEARKKLIKQA